MGRQPVAIESSKLIGMVTHDLGLISSNLETPTPGFEVLFGVSNYLKECYRILKNLIY